MTDLGFGVVDKRSVLVVLFVIGVSNILFGNPLPINTTDALSLFLSLLLLTGFISVTRSAARVLLAISASVLLLPLAVRRNTWYRSEKGTSSGIRGLILNIGAGFRDTWSSWFVKPLFYRRDWCLYVIDERVDERFADRYSRSATRSVALGILGVLDRIALVALAYASTVPSAATWVVQLGEIGIAILTLTYVISRHFTLVLEDATHRSEKDAERRHLAQLYAAQHPDIKFPSSFETRPYRSDPYS